VFEVALSAATGGPAFVDWSPDSVAGGGGVSCRGRGPPPQARAKRQAMHVELLSDMDACIAPPGLDDPRG
jgi:hypothetical protein